MDKTVTISLGGYAFIVDATAYEKIKTYLNQIKNSLSNTDGVEEIISDIESRIAELLKERLNNREVVNDSDIESIINQMGKPEQYSDSEDIFEDEQNPKPTQSSSSFKKLFRNTDDAWLGGVCAGLGEYTNINPLWIRLFFVSPLLFDFVITFGLSSTFTIIAYLILWIVVPEAKTTSQKLQMQGKPINVDSIKELTEKTTNTVTNAANKTAPAVKSFLEVISKILLIVIGIIILIKGVSWIIASLGLLVGSAVVLASYPDQINYMFSNYWLLIPTIILVCATILIPGIFLIMLSFTIFSKRYQVKTKQLMVFGFVWLASLVGAITLIAMISSDYWVESKSVENKMVNIQSDTIQLNLNQQVINSLKKGRSSQFLGDELYQQNGKLYSSDLNFRVYESSSDKVELKIEYAARGRTYNHALANTNNINYNYQVKGDTLLFDNFFNLEKGQQYRLQDVDINIYIPKNKVFYINDFKGLTIDNCYHDNHDWSINNKHFQYQDSQAICLDCTENETIEQDNDDFNLDIDVNDSNEKAHIQINKNGVKITTNQDEDSTTTKDSLKIKKQ